MTNGLYVLAPSPPRRVVSTPKIFAVVGQWKLIWSGLKENNKKWGAGEFFEGTEFGVIG